MVKKLVIAYFLILSPTVTHGDSVTNNIGKFFGEFSAGVGNGVSKTIMSNQPQWITINPRLKKECLIESGNVLNTVYMRCRHGRQEYVRFDANGNKMVLNERSIPLN